MVAAKSTLPASGLPSPPRTQKKSDPGAGRGQTGTGAAEANLGGLARDAARGHGTRVMMTFISPEMANAAARP
jgi:hypothetical protein